MYLRFRNGRMHTVPEGTRLHDLLSVREGEATDGEVDEIHDLIADLLFPHHLTREPLGGWEVCDRPA